MEFLLAKETGKTVVIRTVEVLEPAPDLIQKIIEIDLMTFSEPTWSRYTAGHMLRQGRTFLLTADDDIIGSLTLMRCWDRPSEAFLVSMSLRPGFRGKGLGTRFLQDVGNKLRGTGIRTLQLHVDATNVKAVAAYERFGFRTVDTMVNAYGSGRTWRGMRVQIEGDTLIEVPTIAPPGPFREQAG